MQEGRRAARPSRKLSGLMLLSVIAREPALESVLGKIVSANHRGIACLMQKSKAGRRRNVLSFMSQAQFLTWQGKHLS